MPFFWLIFQICYQVKISNSEANCNSLKGCLTDDFAASDWSVARNAAFWLVDTVAGYSSIAGQQRPSAEGDSTTPLATLQDKRKRNFELPELIHNLNLLVDMTEQDIIAADRKLAYHRDRVEVNAVLSLVNLSKTDFWLVNILNTPLWLVHI